MDQLDSAQPWRTRLFGSTLRLLLFLNALCGDDRLVVDFDATRRCGLRMHFVDTLT